MDRALWLLAVLGVIGAYDTIWYHEWRGRLVARPEMRPELRLHVARDAIYVVIFASLPLVAWRGAWTALLAALLVAEIVITMADFVTEDQVRKGVGGVFPGERVTHAVMGIVYGAMLAFLVPVLWRWLGEPTALAVAPAAVPASLRWGLGAAAAGIALHGLRDLAAVLGLPGSALPWGPSSPVGRPAGASATSVSVPR